MSENLDALAFRFFKLFAQYEATLKEHVYLVAHTHGRIRVDRNRFANEIIGQYFERHLGANASAAEYILESPPMKQALNGNDKIVWVTVANTDKSPQALFGHICRTVIPPLLTQIECRIANNESWPLEY